VELVDDLEQNVPLVRWRVGELVRCENVPNGLGRLVFRAGVHLGEDLVCCDLGPALGVAHDSDGVIDSVLLRASAGSEVNRSISDPDRREVVDVSRSRSGDLAYDGCAR
jgi:hypothetical protein